MLENANSTPSIPAIIAITLLLNIDESEIRMARHHLQNLNLASHLFQFFVLIQRHNQNHNKRDTENDHRPIDKPGERSWIICCNDSLTAPCFKRAAPNQTHHCGAKNATVTHPG